MSTVDAFFLGAGLGGLVVGIVMAYAVGVLMPEHRWLR